ncbi:hypothetical protein AGOR_G00194040 [Albula goreensis]|uniref:PH domain-containing protein n=1 Tax=Albula goreensis TaxID=1534307 RepID=A0A8T3CYV0_9TELE|nr:hypothetical protein AGOR_G00194040 [Albula goreensis]
MEGEHPERGADAAESPALPVRLDPPPVDCDVTAVKNLDPITVDCDVTAVKNLDPTTVDCEVTVAETTVGCDVTVAESTVDCDVTVAESTVDCDVIVAESPVDCDVTVVVTPDQPTVDNGVIVLESCTVPPARQQSSGADPNAGTPQRSREPPPTKLCGYLHKLGGPLKSWKCRWFVYEEEKCQLFYYRTPQDVNPLGRIQLADATFGYPIQADEGTFHIQTPERKFILKAVHREAMMYWLQQLQLRRWQHRGTAGPSAQFCADMHREEGVTYCKDDFLPTVKTPTGLVGEEAAQQPAPRQHATLSNVSFKHP